MSKISAGDLSERITILVQETTDNGLEEISQYAVDRSIWSKVTYISDGEKMRAAALDHQLAIRFIVRKTAITVNDRIFYEGVDYAINGIKPLEKAFLEITTREVT